LCSADQFQHGRALLSQESATNVSIRTKSDTDNREHLAETGAAQIDNIKDPFDRAARRPACRWSSHALCSLAQPYKSLDNLPGRSHLEKRCCVQLTPSLNKYRMSTVKKKTIFSESDLEFVLHYIQKETPTL
jgi:hypothetical protein